MRAARQREYIAAIEGDKRAERARIDAENAEDERAERAAIAARIAAVNGGAPAYVAPPVSRVAPVVTVKRPVTTVDDGDDLTEREAIQAEAAPSVPILGATFTKLRNGMWGARIAGNASPGTIVQMVTRSGRTSLRVVHRVYWSDGATTLASLVES